MKNKNKLHPLVRLAIFLIVVFVGYALLLLDDAILKDRQNRNKSEDITISQDTGEIRAYNVDGLTDEEVDRLIELQRLNKGGE